MADGPAAPLTQTAAARPRRVPLWVKYLLGLPVAVLVGMALHSVTDLETAAALFCWIAFVLLALFPGKDPLRPRLFLVMSFLWTLCIPAIVILVVARSLSQPTALVVLPLAALYAGLVVTLWKRHRAFPVLLIVAVGLEVIGSLVHHATSGATGSVVALVLNLVLHVAIAWYLLAHFRPRETPANP